MEMKTDLAKNRATKIEHQRIRYEAIYGKTDVWLFKKSYGVHSVILQAIHNDLAGARYLDLGCGAGRLPILCSHVADEVIGVDFSPKAIDLARLCAEIVSRDNISFQIGDVDGYCDDCLPESFNVVSLTGVLEHVPQPRETLIRAAELLAPGGLLVVSCPNFVNFRGATYMTLLSLFDLPMSLADLWQIDVEHIREWIPAAGLELEKTLGAIYRFAFDRKSADDMVKRVPLAIRDKKLDIDIDYQAYNNWLNRMAGFNRKYLDWLLGHGALKTITKPVTIQPGEVEGLPQEMAAKVAQYLEEDITSDPYYSDEEPFCYFGGEGIYLLRKAG